MDSEMPYFLVWSLCIKCLVDHRHTVYPNLVSFPVIPISFMCLRSFFTAFSNDNYRMCSQLLVLHINNYSKDGLLTKLKTR